jgi:hypothetical protein
MDWALIKQGNMIKARGMNFIMADNTFYNEQQLYQIETSSVLSEEPLAGIANSIIMANIRNPREVQTNKIMNDRVSNADCLTTKYQMKRMNFSVQL